jgi:putative transposase
LLDLAIMRRIVELHLLYSIAGRRMPRNLLREARLSSGGMSQGHEAAGLEAIYRCLNLPKPATDTNSAQSATQADGKPAEPGLDN